MSISNLKDPSLLKSQSYINGQWTDADSGRTFDVIDPASGEVLAQVADLSAIETGRAIEAADQAMQTWKKQTAKDRSVL